MISEYGYQAYNQYLYLRLTDLKYWNILQDYAEVVQLADTSVSEADAVRLEGSNPSFRTKLFNSKRKDSAPSCSIPSGRIPHQIV